MLIYADSTASYDSTTSATIVKNLSFFTSAGSPFSFRQTGAWGTGSYATVLGMNSTNGGGFAYALPGAATYTVGFRWQTNVTNGNTGQALPNIVYFDGGIRLGLASGNQLVITNTTTSTNIFSSTGTYAASIWHYIEMQVTNSLTNCTINLWVDGTNIYSTTAGGATSISTIPNVRFGMFSGNTYSTSSQTFLYTDIYVTDTTNTDGAGQTGNLGPIRIENPAPNGDGANTAWTVAVGANACTANQFSPSTTTGFVADTNCTISAAAAPDYLFPNPYEIDQSIGMSTSLHIVPSGNPTVFTTSTGTGGFAVSVGTLYTVSALVRNSYVSAGQNFTIGIRWYTSGGVVIQTDASSNFLIAASTWGLVYFNGTAPATAAFAAIVVSLPVWSGSTWDATALSFIPTPATLSSGQVFTGAIIKNPSLSGTAHYVNINDPVADTGTFNRNPGAASNVGDKDTYTITSLNSTTGTPLAVVVTNVAMKENSNPRSIAPVIRTASTNYVGTSQALNNDTAYHAFQNIWALDPNTGVAWTIAQVNAIEAGLEISA